MSDPSRWTTPDRIVAALRRRWDDGSLLRAWVSSEPFPTVEIALRGPGAADLGPHFDAARAWSTSIRRASQDGRAFTVIEGRIGGRLAGHNDIPVRVVITTYAQAWRVLGSEADATAFADLVTAAEAVPRAREWALSVPLAALRVAPEWPTVLNAYAWLDTHRGSPRYLREVDAPGVDTKFIERHRATLAALLGVPASAGAFTRALGFASKPSTVRLKFAPEALGMPAGLTEAVLRTDELRRLDVHIHHALIVENEISYLSAPIPPAGVVLWGRGYDADQPASLDWLRDAEVSYWGDIDTHGFAILNRVRARLPHTRSVLMDRETLLAHEARWGSENSPTDVALPGLDGDEAALYADLVSDRYGRAVRLEQERVDWSWAAARLRERIGGGP